MIALPHLSAIRFGGADAGEFLHNQVSADVLGLDDGASTFACYCEPKGRVLALMLVCRIDDAYCVIMSSALAPSVVARLKIYVMRSKVAIEVMENVTVCGILADEDAPEGVIPAVAIPGSDRRLLVTAAASAPDMNAIDQWKIEELKRGITWMCPETSGEFLPQMLGFDELGAVNFRKGCYPGQEIVARTHYLGKVKRHPRRLHTSAKICPEPLDKVQILSGEKSHDAVIVDCGKDERGTCLLTVTRMDPELNAAQLEYCGQIAPLLE